MRVEDLLVGDGLDAAARLVARRHGLLPRRRVADADRGRDRLGVVDRVAERRCGAAPAAWKPHMRRCVAGRLALTAARRVLAVAPPVRRDVAGVADRQAVDVGRVAERVDDLEAAVFWPSMRAGLTELTSSTG